MKKILVTLVVALSFAFLVSSAQAAPDTVTLAAAKKGPITLNHKKHMVKGCKNCHAGAPGKIATKGMVWGHKTCKDNCHKAKNVGPKVCDDCHKKK